MGRDCKLLFMFLLMFIVVLIISFNISSYMFKMADGCPHSNPVTSLLQFILQLMSSIIATISNICILRRDGPDNFILIHFLTRRKN